MVLAKFSKRGQIAPANPANPARLPTTVLPAWMYRDPAEVAERVEQAELARVERARKRRDGLLGAGTVRLINRMRIRELVANQMKGRR